jgi:hypothetical protein
LNAFIRDFAKYCRNRYWNLAKHNRLKNMDNLENVLKIIEKQKKITVDQVANQYHGSFETLSNELRKVSDDELSKYKWGNGQ